MTRKKTQSKKVKQLSYKLAIVIKNYGFFGSLAAVADDILCSFILSILLLVKKTTPLPTKTAPPREIQTSPVTIVLCIISRNFSFIADKVGFKLLYKVLQFLLFWCYRACTTSVALTVATPPPGRPRAQEQQAVVESLMGEPPKATFMPFRACRSVAPVKQ